VVFGGILLRGQHIQPPQKREKKGGISARKDQGDNKKIVEHIKTWSRTEKKRKHGKGEEVWSPRKGGKKFRREGTSEGHSCVESGTRPCPAGRPGGKTHNIPGKNNGVPPGVRVGSEKKSLEKKKKKGGLENKMGCPERDLVGGEAVCTPQGTEKRKKRGELYPPGLPKVVFSIKGGGSREEGKVQKRKEGSPCGTTNGTDLGWLKRGETSNFIGGTGCREGGLQHFNSYPLNHQ